MDDLINNLTAQQMSNLYDFIGGPVPLDIQAMSDDELLAELAA